MMPNARNPFLPNDGADVSRREFLERAAAMGASAALLGACARQSIVGSANGIALPARASNAGSDFTLANSAISGTWTVDGGKLRVRRIADLLNGGAVQVPGAPFVLDIQDSEDLAADQMRIVSGPTITALAANPNASRMSERLAGQQAEIILEDSSGRLRVTWRSLLRDGSTYLRQDVTLAALREPVPIRRIALVALAAPNVQVSGSVKGSPIVAGTWYAGFEHPLAISETANGRARSWLPRELPLRPGAPISVSSVIGVTRSGQLRRDFLDYVERERAHPYRPFLHYNSWYDIGYFSKYSEPEALDVINRFGTELHRKRDVVLSSFLFDDGWDDPKTLWGFHSGFPTGFTNVRHAAEKYGAEPGIWLSPWGGYGKPKQDRIAEAITQGFETNKGGFALSAPKYYRRFHDTCIDMIRRYGVNQFKIDGTGNVSSAYPGSAFDSDFDAAISLIGDLRREKPDLFVNLTTGTFPSPFWLRYADSIWRGGEDHSFAGVGSDRQQWITYKDGDTFRGIVSKGPLFPLNSLMLHGLIYARHANKLNTDPHHDFRSEIQAYFGTGTQLQEMYVTPSLLSSDDWDSLAEGARWARRQSARLVDTHWIGGDPRQLEPYGHAAWTPEGGVLSLRNPSDKPQSITIDLEKAFELPSGAAHQYSARSPWAADRTHMPIRLTAAEPHTFTLAPFQVLTLDVDPR